MTLLLAPNAVRTISIAIALVSVGFFSVRMTRYASRPTFGFQTYYSSAALVSTGIPAGILYDDSEFIREREQKTGIRSKEPFAPNPPVIAILFIPLTLVSLHTAKVVWECLSLGFLIVFFFMIRKEKKFDSTESFALIAFVFAFTPLFMDFVYGQVYVLLLLLASCVYLALRTGNTYWAAFFMASLVLLKGFGAFLVLLLMLRKEWKILGLTVCMIIAGVSISAALVGMGAWVAYGASILEVILHAGASSQRNLAGLVGTITNIAVGSSWAASVTSAGLVAGGAGILLWANRRPHSGDIPTQFGIAVLLSLLCTPIIADYHYALLLLPLFFLYDRLRHGFSYAYLPIIATALFLVSVKLPMASWISGRAADLLIFPRVYGTLLLLVLFLLPEGPGSNRPLVPFSTAFDEKQ